MNTKIPSGLKTSLRKILPAWMQANDKEEIVWFVRTITLTSAAAATAVSVIKDSEVPLGGFKPYVTDVYGKVTGGTLWATTATVKVQDTNGTPVDFVTFAVAGLTANAKQLKGTANITWEDAMLLSSGGTSGKGLQVVGNANGTGSDLSLTIVGYYKKAS